MSADASVAGPPPKTAIFSWFSRPVPPDERLRAIRDAGFDGVMLWWDASARREGRAEQARRLGLEVANVHLPFADVNRLWGEDGGDECLDELRRCLGDCRRQDVGVAVLHVTDFAATPPVTERGVARLLELVECAERLDVTLAAENLLGTAHLEALFARIASPRFGFCLDVGHEHCAPHPPDCLERFGHRLRAVHLHDNPGDADAHLLPFDGTVDWPRTLDRLRRAAPLDYLGLEADADPDRPESAAYRELTDAEYLARARERAERLRRMWLRTPGDSGGQARAAAGNAEAE